MQEKIQQSIQFIEKNAGRNISVKEIADYIFLSPRQFSRLFKKHTGKSPLKYIEQQKMEKAMVQPQHDTQDLKEFLIRKGYEAIPFVQNAIGHLLITVTVNDVPGLFILDTGAGGTVIETSQADRLKLVLQTDNVQFNGGGAGGVGLEVIPSTGNTIVVGKYVAKDLPLSVMSLENVIQALTLMGAAEEFVGILGADVLKPGKAIIDYSAMTLYLLSDSNVSIPSPL